MSPSLFQSASMYEVLAVAYGIDLYILCVCAQAFEKAVVKDAYLIDFSSCTVCAYATLPLLLTHTATTCYVAVGCENLRTSEF